MGYGSKQIIIVKQKRWLLLGILIILVIEISYVLWVDLIISTTNYE